MEAKRVHTCIQDVHPVFSNSRSAEACDSPPDFLSCSILNMYVTFLKKTTKKWWGKKEKKKGGLDLQRKPESFRF